MLLSSSGRIRLGDSSHYSHLAVCAMALSHDGKLFGISILVHRTRQVDDGVALNTVIHNVRKILANERCIVTAEQIRLQSRQVCNAYDLRPAPLILHCSGHVVIEFRRAHLAGQHQLATVVCMVTAWSDCPEGGLETSKL